MRQRMLPVLFGFFFCSTLPLTAFGSTDEEIQALQTEIQNKKAQIDQINTQLADYKKKIAQYDGKAKTLSGDLAVLENDIAVSELNIAESQTEIDATNLEVRLLDSRIIDETAKVATQTTMLKDTLFALRQNDRHIHAVALLTAKDFKSVFQAATALQTLSGGVKKQLVAARNAKDTLTSQKIDRQQKVVNLQELQQTLARKSQELEDRKTAKTLLLAETKDSESKYRDLLSDLRSEQEAITQRIDGLTRDIESRLAKQAPGAGDTLDAATISWPLQGIITTLFHDPTYPYRNIVGEHSGLDIATAKGTPVGAAAPGIVAWKKTGKGYGNYIMIIHQGGTATLYAHLSRMDVVQDQYVTRGQIIGLSGGRPGDQGSGFSSGPHLHFEVRVNGIPVNPFDYLPKE